jgi:hypothetical protein
MFYIQVTLPAVLVILAFTLGHSFVAVDYSGVYFEETEEVIEETVSVETQILDDGTEVQLDEDGLPLLPDKYNYLKIENVFQGRLSDTDELFSFEIALATYQTNVTADFFIKGLYEIEADLVSEVTTIILDTKSYEITTIEGRRVITQRIMDGLNTYLEKEGYNPDIHYIYIINYNVI